MQSNLFNISRTVILHRQLQLSGLIIYFFVPALFHTFDKEKSLSFSYVGTLDVLLVYAF